MKSPYKGKSVVEWNEITKGLIEAHLLDNEEIVKIILESWEAIFNSKIANLTMGTDIIPNPQMLGFFIESITAAKLAEKHPSIWKHGKSKDEKDIVCLTDNNLSIEMKASSSSGKIFGNRSYAQEQSKNATKDKSGYYLTVNFEKSDGITVPKITLIRFGYIEHSDWRAQKSAKGQQANLPPEVYKNKFVTLYEKIKVSKKEQSVIAKKVKQRK